MNKSHEHSTPMVVKSLEVDKDPYKPKEDNEDILGPEVPYLSALLKHLFILQITSCLILHFVLYLLARISASPEKRY